MITECVLMSPASMNAIVCIPAFDLHGTLPT